MAIVSTRDARALSNVEPSRRQLCTALGLGRSEPVRHGVLTEVAAELVRKRVERLALVWPMDG